MIERSRRDSDAELLHNKHQVPEGWAPGSWRRRRAMQQPSYPDEAALTSALAAVRNLPPIVTSGEVDTLLRQLAEVALGRRFVLWGGDCSERFDECTSASISAKLKVLLQMSLILLDASKMKVTRIGRMAGQYAKPRSQLIETRDGVELPAYQGDLINAPGFTRDERLPDPQRLIEGYHRSVSTINFIRGLVGGNFSNLDYPDYWNLRFVAKSRHSATYRRMIRRVIESLQFMEATAGSQLRNHTRFDFFTSHEALHLAYEEALTQFPPYRDGAYNLGTHLPWIGERTRALDSSHIEYCRGIQNPVGVKIGPSVDPEEAVALAKVINPRNIPGKLTFIHRMGAHKIDDALPPVISAIRAAGCVVVWCCDPMHGNTVVADNGFKTRDFAQILDEVRRAFRIHAKNGSFLGGIHLELTGDHVTECTGGAEELSGADLTRAYRSLVDPRLNHEQALQMALEVGRVMRKWRGVGSAT